LNAGRKRPLNQGIGKTYVGETEPLGARKEGHYDGTAVHDPKIGLYVAQYIRVKHFHNN
jgi:hypothetical protein